MLCDKKHSHVQWRDFKMNVLVCDDDQQIVDGHATITPPGLRIATVLLRLETSIPTAVISIDFIFPASFLCLFRLMPITDSACFVTRMYSDKSR